MSKILKLTIENDDLKKGVLNIRGISPTADVLALRSIASDITNKSIANVKGFPAAMLVKAELVTTTVEEI